MMNAAIYRSFGGPIKIEKVPIPSIPDEDSILVQVQATGVCRSDWHGWKGHDGDIREHGLPFVPGHEFSGIVARVGRNLQEFFRTGDRVVSPFILSCGDCQYCRKQRPTICARQQQPGFTYWGSFAEYAVIPRAKLNVKHIPNNVSFVQAAALGCRFTTAYRAVKQQGRLNQGETIAIFGCGGVGLSCIMMAKALGASSIMAVDISKQALALAKDLGATHTIDASIGDQGVRTEISKFSKGDGADICVDAAGFPSTCENAVFCTAPGGRMIQVGLPIGDVAPKVPMGYVAGKEIEIYGSHGFAADELPELLDLIAKGLIDPGKLVSLEATLAEGAKAIQNMDIGSPAGIIMVTCFKHCNL